MDDRGPKANLGIKFSAAEFRHAAENPEQPSDLSTGIMGFMVGGL
jgi:hypothetical protein